VFWGDRDIFLETISGTTTSNKHYSSNNRQELSIFVSYVNEDKSFVNKVLALLIRKYPRVNIQINDESLIPIGVNFRQAMINMINSSDFVLLFFTKHYEKSIGVFNSGNAEFSILSKLDIPYLVPIIEKTNTTTGFFLDPVIANRKGVFFSHEDKNSTRRINEELNQLVTAILNDKLKIQE